MSEAQIRQTATGAQIGDRAIASSKSGIHGEIAAGEVVSGYPAISNRLWLRCSAAFAKVPEMAKQLRELKKEIASLKDTPHAPQ